jgi:ubiquinone/menaquinone biosynthesis C-methylase UbiE
VVTVPAAYEDSKLRPRSVDMVFLRDAYHDFQNRVEYFSRLKKVLKPGGRIVIIDYDPAKLGFLRRLHGHYLDEKIIIEEMKQAGYVKKASFPVLKKQSFNVFGTE